ncbi:hypothetical protein IST4112_00177 [Burkholderia cenocepacia]|nr:hypothetical protein IST4113_00177 [Burkholderia cenocepacia]CAB5095669.1 hypothetical protein IST4112_00177 [Burkholderia cenocepacia]CAB5096828.1 hypothetical protein IST4116B_00177 [Burkholderia cenocepacia]
MRSCRRFWSSGDNFAKRDAIFSHFRLRASLKPSHWSANGARAACCAGVRRAHASGPAAAGSGKGRGRGSGGSSVVSPAAADAGAAGLAVATGVVAGAGWNRGYVAT